MELEASTIYTHRKNVDVHGNGDLHYTDRENKIETNMEIEISTIYR